MNRAPRADAVLARLDGLPAVRAVSLDVFDTLLVRLVPPAHALRATIAALAAALAAAELGETPSAAAIATHRDAFASAADKHTSNGGEFTISQWLAALADTFELPRDRVLALGTSTEPRTEWCLTCADPDAIELVDALRRRRLPIVATSDTWLDKPVLASLLAHHNIVPDQIFASGSLGASKRRGSLFAHVSRALALPPRAILHVGDNLKSDLARAAAAGLEAIAWRRRAADAPRMLAQRVPELAAALAVAPPTAAHRDGALYEAGRTLLAPMLVATTIAQHAQLNAARAQHVLYIARDAWPLFGVAERLDKLLAPARSRSYIRLSRRALSLAHPGNLLAQSTGLAGRFGKSNAGELLAGFDLAAELHYDLLAAAGLSDDSPLRPAALAALRRACVALAPRIEAAQIEQRALLREYLTSHGVRPQQRLAIVDTGWAGTTQDALAAVLPDVECLVGFYLGVSRGGLGDTPQSSKGGLLWDDPGGLAPINPLERSAGVIRVWDLLMREPAPTVRCLRRQNDGTVAARLYESRSGFDVAAATELSAGISAGVGSIEPRLPALLSVFATSDPVWREAARALASQLTTCPSRDFANEINMLAIDEGAAQGARTGLGLRDLRRGLAWYPGVAAQFGVGDVANRAVELLRRQR